jgi:hypothetical protein
MSAIRMTLRALFAGAVMLIATGSAVEAVTLLVTQEPCTMLPASRHCIRFENPGGAETIAQISFRPPAVGKAKVSVNGTVVCTNVGGARGGVSFETQIVNKADEDPRPQAPGGAIHSFTVEPAGGQVPNGTYGFNLGSERVFPIRSTARKNFYLRIVPTRLDSDISCDFFNLTMTILFTDGN